MANELIVQNKDGLAQLLTTMQDSIATVLPKHLTPARIMKIAQLAASRNPTLFQCTKASLAKSIMSACELGLDCSGTLGSAYLVPYRNGKTGNYEAQFIPGYRGLIDLARRSGQISRIEAHVVRQRDKFSVAFGLNPILEHAPQMDGDPGAMICVYAVAELRDGVKQLEVMTRSEVDSIRARSKASASGPWVTDYEEMARKTVVRRLMKYLPLSVEIEAAIAADDEQYQTIDAEVVKELPPGKINFRKKAANPRVPLEPDDTQPAPPAPDQEAAQPDESPADATLDPAPEPWKAEPNTKADATTIPEAPLLGVDENEKAKSLAASLWGRARLKSWTRDALGLICAHAVFAGWGQPDLDDYIENGSTPSAIYAAINASMEAGG